MGLSIFFSLKKDDLVVLLFEEIVKFDSFFLEAYWNEFSFQFDISEFLDRFELLKHDFLAPLFCFYLVFYIFIYFTTFKAGILVWRILEFMVGAQSASIMQLESSFYSLHQFKDDENIDINLIFYSFLSCFITFPSMSFTEIAEMLPLN